MRTRRAALLAAVLTVACSRDESPIALQPAKALAVPAPSPTPSPPAMTTRAAALQEAAAIVADGSAMAVIRMGSLNRNLEAGIECTKRMRANFPRVEALRAAANALPDRLMLDYTDFFGCVNCADDGDLRCAKASLQLEKAGRSE